MGQGSETFRGAGGRMGIKEEGEGEKKKGKRIMLCFVSKKRTHCRRGGKGKKRSTDDKGQGRGGLHVANRESV